MSELQQAEAKLAEAQTSGDQEEIAAAAARVDMLRNAAKQAAKPKPKPKLPAEPK